VNLKYKNKKQSMESNATTEKERVFRERTGKDFTSLYKKYYPKLIYFTSRICNDQKKAEDISTESFIIALEKIEKYDKEKSQFSTWLFTIAKNLSLQELKNSKKTISLDVEYDEDGTTMKDFITEETNNSEEAYRILDLKAEIMRNYIDDLKEPYKTVIEMREIKRMSYQDIADKLGRNLSTIKSQIRNGRHILISQSAKEFSCLNEQYI
jgi:RNA polymerase sigma-70 factor (ECF subfamily)